MKIELTVGYGVNQAYISKVFEWPFNYVGNKISLGSKIIEENIPDLHAEIIADFDEYDYVIFHELDIYQDYISEDKILFSVHAGTYDVQ